MQQLELFSISEPAMTPEERRARGRDGRCQNCDRALTPAELDDVMAHGWCAACSEEVALSSDEAITQERGAHAASGHATPPMLAPGYYRLRKRPARVWSHDELELILIDGVWHVVPRVVLAALTAGCAVQADGTIRDVPAGAPDAHP